MKKRIYVLAGGILLVVLILVAVYVRQNGVPTIAPRTVGLTTQDGLSLKTSFYPAKGTELPAPALLLLPMAYSDRRAWHDFAQNAQGAGYAVLALDLRGHGDSAGEKVFDTAMDLDVDAALMWLMARPDVDSERVGIAGASVGANLALRAGARYPEIESVALLSPGMQLWDIGIQEAIVDYGKRAVLIIVSEEDAYPAGSCQQLDAMALGEHRLHVYPGAAHGTDMFPAHDTLTSVLLDWFSVTLK